MKSNPPLESLILTLRQQKVILDADLAGLYGVPTKRLNEAVKRNAERFPADFMFQPENRSSNHELHEYPRMISHFRTLTDSPYGGGDAASQPSLIS